MIVFNKLTYKNFLACGNTPITLELDKSATTLISAENGNGKSSWVDALTFACFGKSFRKINKPNLVNNVNKRGCVVTIEFTVGGESWKVVRGLAPGIFEIYKNGKMLDQQAGKLDQQDWFEKNVLKMNYTTFCQVVVLGTANYTPFLHLSAHQRREVIESLLDIRVFSVMNQLLRQRVSGWASEVDSLKSDERVLDSQISVHEQYSKSRSDELQEQIQQKKSSLVGLEHDLRALATAIKDIDEEATQRSSEEAELTVKYKEANTKLQRGIASLVSETTELQRRIEFFENESICQECAQCIDENHAARAIDKLYTGLKTKSALLEKARGVIPKIDAMGEKCSELHFIVSELKEKRASLMSSVKSTKSLIESNRREIASLEEKLIEASDSRELFDLNTKKTEISKVLSEKLQMDDVFQASKELLKDSGIKAVVLREFMPVINACINKYLNLFDFYVKFELDENFSETIHAGGREGFSYNNFSQGERARVDIAILMAWREIARLRAQVNCNLLILDEVFDSSLDAKGADDLMNILNSMGNNSNVFIISHRGDHLVDKLDAHIRFEKIKGFSRIAEEK